MVTRLLRCSNLRSKQAEASPGYIRQLPDAEWVPGGDRLRSPYYTGGRSPELDAEAAPRVI